jgi:hypothetical protein
MSAKQPKNLSAKLLKKIKADRQKDDNGEGSVETRAKRYKALKDKFENMDFALRERINNKFIEHLQTSK